jgi:hypothetical protein
MDSFETKARTLGLLGLLTLLTLTVGWWREDGQAWRGYQQAAYRSLAAQARSDLRTAAAASDRLAAQAQLDRAEAALASPLEPIPVVPTQSGKPEMCLTCHLGIEEISASHPVEAFGCVVCHGGDRLALDKELAHVGLRGGANPSRLEVAAESCGQVNCHGGWTESGPGNRNMVDRVTRSLQATYAGGIALVRYSLGAQSSRDPLYATHAVTATGTVTSPALSRLLALPAATPGGTSVDDRFQRSCLSDGCHLWAAPRQADYFYRGEGCAACHVRYAVDGTYRGGDVTLPQGQPGHPVQHRMSAAIPFNTCDACHNRGNYDVASMSFAARTDLDARILAALPSSQRRLQEYYQPIGLFTRCEWELDCVDCHTANQVMGYGDIRGNIKDSQTTQCLTCHGTLNALPPVAQVTAADDPAVRQARVSGAYEVRVGDWLAVTKNGEKLPNVRRVNDRFVLTMKVTGQQYTIPLVMGSSCQEKQDQQESAACHECHAVKR